MQRFRLFLIIALLAALGGCSWFGGEPDAEQDRIEKLQVPPDLTLEQQQRALSIPEGGGPGDSVSASGEQGPVLPQPRRVQVHRVGSDRWLTVDADPKEVWSWLDDYMQRQGVGVARRREDLGIMETEWLYTNKPLTHGPFAPVLAGPDDATVADRYLVRVEPGRESGTADVFVANRRAARDSDDRWRLRPADPFLEAEFLRSMMLYMGVQAEDSFERVATAPSAGPGSDIERTEDGGLRLVIHSAFFDAWRRLGLALDRAGFTVESRARDDRYIAIRYDTRAQQGPREEGFFESLAFWRGDDIPDTVKEYRLSLSEAADADVTRVRLTRADGESASPEITEEILGLLEEQIR